ncbi:MAG: class I SAM-dependent methyltransferase [Actinomycetota bacterium]|nr:class I SAM-dependent methyltransferase [Actinomycetota bacterium]
MPEFAEALRCSSCRTGDLEDRGEQFVCTSCSRSYLVVGGIPRLVDSLPGDVLQVQRVFDFEHRRFEDSWYTRFEPRLVEQFLGECGLPREFFRGKRALDAGCGSGRWTYALAQLGADVVGCDLTAGGLEAAHANLPQENVRLYQADLFRLPFAPDSYDFVVSWGVLHHTPDTHLAFRQLVPLVRPGGTMFVMVYEKQNALRSTLTNALRWFMRRLPDERRYEFCRRLVIKNHYVAGVLGHFVMVGYLDPKNPDLDEQTIQFGLFDAYSPRFNHTHTAEEVVGWFRDEGFKEVITIDMPGAVRVRGVRAH